MGIEQDVYPAATVLVVDDTPDNLMLMTDLLKDRYRVCLLYTSPSPRDS